MTLVLSDDVFAAWRSYEARNQRANEAYEALSLFACRTGCGQDFGSHSARQFHERWCGK